MKNVKYISNNCYSFHHVTRRIQKLNTNWRCWNIRVTLFGSHKRQYFNAAISIVSTTALKHKMNLRRSRWSLNTSESIIAITHVHRITDKIANSRSFTFSLSWREIIGTGGYMRNVSMMQRSRYFICNVSWNVTGRSESPNIEYSSSTTFS